jgi:hypothetical protein
VAEASIKHSVCKGPGVPPGPSFTPSKFLELRKAEVLRISLLQQRSKALTRLRSWSRLAAITFWQDEYRMLVQSF